METVLNNKYFIGIAAAIGSMLLTILAQYLLNKRSLFRYFVWHNRVGVTTDDAIFGSVSVTWNNRIMANLYLSTIELINESMKDFENVIVRVFSNDTQLLTERTEVVGTTHFLQLTDEYAQRLTVPRNQTPTEAQINLYASQRDYLIPTMNRGQAIRFIYLNSATTQNQPTIWLDIVHKGVKLNFRVAHNKVFGVPQPNASLIGLIVCLFVFVVVIIFVDQIWLAATISFLLGLFAQILGAFVLKIWLGLKNLLGG
jgi:hypothetical protein